MGLVCGRDSSNCMPTQSDCILFPTTRARSLPTRLLPMGIKLQCRQKPSISAPIHLSRPEKRSCTIHKFAVGRARVPALCLSRSFPSSWDWDSHPSPPLVAGLVSRVPYSSKSFYFFFSSKLSISLPITVPRRILDIHTGQKGNVFRAHARQESRARFHRTATKPFCALGVGFSETRAPS